MATQVQGNPGSATITIPTSIPTGDNYKVRLTSCLVTGTNTACSFGAVDLSDANFTITAPVTGPHQITICHKTGNDSFTEITTNYDGWTNGHSHHVGDYIKTSLGPCRTSTTTVEPITSNTNPGTSKDEYIKKLLARIAALEYRLSELEQKVITRAQTDETKVNPGLSQRLKGTILLDVDHQGEAWFIGADGKKYYLANGKTAFEILKAFGTGINEADFAKLSETESTPFGLQHEHQIFIRVESHGEAYYIHNGIAIYLKNGEAAFKIMQQYSLGARPTDINAIDTGNLAE